MTLSGRIVFLLLAAAFRTASCAGTEDSDPNGYVMFCPCMGRFGNQADHYLGALNFAAALNRTLVLPPFVEYRRNIPKAVTVPFATYFDLDDAKRHHKVTSMEDFFSSEHLTKTVWPKTKRRSFCGSPRTVLKGQEADDVGGGPCHAKNGNPFGPFWDAFGVDFVGSEIYSNSLHFNVRDSPSVAVGWANSYPSSEHPVLAFVGAPAAFPVQEKNVGLHRLLFFWNQRMDLEASNFAKTNLPKGAYVGIHLRNGADWERACEMVGKTHSLFSSPQCLGYRNEFGNLTKALCLPDFDEILKKIRRAVKSVKAKAVFVATDHDAMDRRLEEALKGVKVVSSGGNDPHLDLAVLGRANYFVGNCVSSFSAFVKRERDAKGFPSAFFGFPAMRRRREEL